VRTRTIGTVHVGCQGAGARLALSSIEGSQLVNVSGNDI
jgi:hypothetical protein